MDRINVHTHTHYTHIHTHLGELVNNTRFQSGKQIHTIYLKQRRRIFCLKEDHHMNQV